MNELSERETSPAERVRDEGIGVHEYRFVRRYLERRPQLPLTLHQVDPLIRELAQYRDLIQQRTKEQETNELD